MTAMSPAGLFVVTGPLSLNGVEQNVFLEPGEVVELVPATEDYPGVAYVYGYESDVNQYIDRSSLTPLSEIQDDPEVQWGDLIDPEYIHDYVYEGDDE